MGKKRKLRKKMRRRDLEDVPALVVCTGKKCAPRELACAVVEEARAYAAASAPADEPADEPAVRIVTVGCLGICEKGPIAATYPRIRFKKHVDARKARRLVDKIARR